jgi:hypothetical protein
VVIQRHIGHGALVRFFPRRGGGDKAGVFLQQRQNRAEVGFGVGAVCCERLPLALELVPEPFVGVVVRCGRVLLGEQQLTLPIEGLHGIAFFGWVGSWCIFFSVLLLVLPFQRDAREDAHQSALGWLLLRARFRLALACCQVVCQLHELIQTGTLLVGAREVAVVVLSHRLRQVAAELLEVGLLAPARAQLFVGHTGPPYRPLLELADIVQQRCQPNRMPFHRRTPHFFDSTRYLILLPLVRFLLSQAQSNGRRFSIFSSAKTGIYWAF